MILKTGDAAKKKLAANAGRHGKTAMPRKNKGGSFLPGGGEA